MVLVALVLQFLLVLLQDFWGHIDPISSAHLVIESEMLGYIDKLHHRDVRDSQLDQGLVSV